jgi:hypothetical protein
MKPRFGVPWYRPSDWRAIRAAAVDPDEMESSYDDWVRLSSSSCAELSADGIDVARIQIEADELIRWCREQRIPLDAHARTRFASDKFCTRKREARLPAAAARCPGAGGPGR